MENKFLKGILTVIAYYAAGGLLAYISYMLIGDAYAHRPALHHLILIGLWIGGCAWALYSIVNRFMGRNVAFHRGAALANVVVCAATFVVVQQQVRAYSREEAGLADQNSVITEFSGDTTIVRHDGTIVFLRIGDSVYLDELSKIYPPDSLLNKR